MINLNAIRFAAKVQIGYFIKANGLIMRVDEITIDSFRGKMIYKNKERDEAVLSFSTLLNPHYCKKIEILTDI